MIGSWISAQSAVYDRSDSIFLFLQLRSVARGGGGGWLGQWWKCPDFWFQNVGRYAVCPFPVNSGYNKRNTALSYLPTDNKRYLDSSLELFLFLFLCLWNIMGISKEFGAINRNARVQRAIGSVIQVLGWWLGTTCLSLLFLFSLIPNWKPITRVITSLH